MKTDVNGCSTCPAGEERYEHYTCSFSRKERVQYDYRHPNGRLFSVVANSLEDARRRRDTWVKDIEVNG